MTAVKTEPYTGPVPAASDGASPPYPALQAAPFNPTTGAEYQGGNVTRLLEAQAASGYPTPEWAGYRQWQAAGRQVRRGERATACVRVVRPDPESTETRVRGFKVFNVAQTDEVVA